MNGSPRVEKYPGFSGASDYIFLKTDNVKVLQDAAESTYLPRHHEEQRLRMSGTHRHRHHHNSEEISDVTSTVMQYLWLAKSDRNKRND